LTGNPGLLLDLIRHLSGLVPVLLSREELPQLDGRQDQLVPQRIAGTLCAVELSAFYAAVPRDG
jgi:hypothetical protein